MEIVFHRGAWVAHHSNMSTMILSAGSTGYTHACCAMYSLRMSFCTVPRSFSAEKQGVSSEKLRGTVQNDILKEYMAQHAWVYPVEPALRIIVDMFEWCATHAPLWNTISISGYHIREAGATAAQELAFTLANGFTYVERGVARGLDVDAFAPRLS